MRNKTNILRLSLCLSAVCLLAMACEPKNQDNSNLALLSLLGGSDANSSASDPLANVPRTQAEVLAALNDSPEYQELLRQEAEESDPSRDSTEDATDSLLAPGAEKSPGNSMADSMAAKTAGGSAGGSVARDGGRFNGSNGYHHVILKRVTYCGETGWFDRCKRWDTPSEFSAWTSEGVDRGKRKDTYIAHMAQAPKNDTEYLLFGGAGQQPPGNGVDNSVTGQAAGYKSGFDKTTAALWRSMDKNAMMLRANDASIPGTYGRLFHPSKTFSAVAYDTKLNFQVGKAEKGKIERAYFKWLTSKAYPHKVKLIYLAGSSRGGCLALRLAKLFRQSPTWKNVPLILHSADGTCAWASSPVDDYVSQQYEIFGNPVGYLTGEVRYAYMLNPEWIFPARSKMCMRHVASGDHVVLPVVRQWAYGSYDRDSGWFQHKWLTHKHKTIGRKYEVSEDTIDPFLSHLKIAYRRLVINGDDACDPKPIGEETGVVVEEVVAPVGGGSGTSTGTGVSPATGTSTGTSTGTATGTGVSPATGTAGSTGTSTGTGVAPATGTAPATGSSGTGTSTGTSPASSR